MDNDFIIIVRVKVYVNLNIFKCFDSNYIKKGFIGVLVELSSVYKVLRNVKVRGYMELCFMYCIQQNKDNFFQIEIDFRNIVFYLYGQRILL